MKKILFIAMFMLGAATSGHAAMIDGQSDGTSKHTITGFGDNDIFQADSNATVSSVALTDVGGAVTDNTSLNTDGIVDGFIHDYLFNTIATTFLTVSSVSETGGSQSANFINPLVLEIWEIVAMGPDVLIGTDTMSQIGVNSREASVSVLLEAGKNYVVRMSNEGGVAGSSPDYSMEIVSAVPVPAAVWLFGTALVGLFGFGRRKAAKAVAA